MLMWAAFSASLRPGGVRGGLELQHVERLARDQHLPMPRPLMSWPVIVDPADDLARQDRRLDPVGLGETDLGKEAAPAARTSACEGEWISRCRNSAR